MQVLKAAFQCQSIEEFAQRHISDVSSAGMFFRSSEPLEVGTRLRFEFTFADGEPLLDGQAVVVWVTEDSGNPQLPAGMELRFEALPGESERRFEWLQMVKRGAALALPTDAGPEQEPAAAVPEPGASQPTPSAARSSIGRTASPHIPDEYKEDEERAVAPGPTAAPAPSGKVSPEGPVVAAPRRAAAEASDPDDLFHSLARSEPDLSDRQAARRRWLLGLAGLVLVLGAGGAIAYRALRSPDADPPDPDPRRHLVRLTSDPAGAEVLVDGRTAGRTPLEAPVQPGSRLVLKVAGRDPQEIALAGLKGWVREGDARVLNLIVQLPSPAAPGPATVRTWIPPEREACKPAPQRAVAAPRPARPAAHRPSGRDVGPSPDSRPGATDSAATAASRPSGDAAVLEAAPPRPAGVKAPVWVDRPQNPPKP